jgi:Na+(H+)/acetate symporter ActP
LNWTVAGLVLLALVLANLPFLTERILFVWEPRNGRKSVPWRLLELVLLYFVTGAIAYAMEARLGPVHRQSWEFYVITASLFLVFAYPGFVYRYLWRRGS